MNKLTLKTAILLAIVTLITSTSITWAQKPDKSKPFKVQITDKPLTFCNPLNLRCSPRQRTAPVR